MSFEILFPFGLWVFEPAGPPRHCSFDECVAAGCDVSSAPYLCLDSSTAYYGCSSSPWDPSYCGESCDLTFCDTTKPSTNQSSCKGIACSADRCDPDMLYQRCGSEVPYQCLEGSSAMGCSDDPYRWLLVESTTCGGCCDTSLC